MHCPFQDDEAVGAALEFVKWFKPKTLFFLGDLVDFYAISNFKRNPQRRLELQDEIDAATSILGMFRHGLPSADTTLLRGNHELRHQSYLWGVAPELSGLRSIKLDELLELKKLKIKYVESGSMMFHGLLIKHGNIVRQHSCYSARAEQERNGVSGVSGHTHRLGQIFKRDFGGEYTWVESGCLCRTDEVEYLEGQTANWQQGITVGFFKGGSGRFSISPIPIVGGKLIFDLKEFSGLQKMSKNLERK